jgi:hypothetical protein
MTDNLATPTVIKTRNPGAGRPRRSEGPGSLLIPMTQESRQMMDALVEKTGISQTALVRLWIAKAYGELFNVSNS